MSLVKRELEKMFLTWKKLGNSYAKRELWYIPFVGMGTFLYWNISSLFERER